MSFETELEELVLPPNYAKILWNVSWLSLASAVYACHRGYYDLAIVPGGVWITSINYWRKPDYSWRRYVDMGYVHTALVYQLLRAHNSEHQRIYYTVLAIGCVFFPLGVYFHKKMDVRKSTWCHGMVHLLGNVSNVILYSGYVTPLCHCGWLSWWWGEGDMSITV
jgi:hypothetical protein